MRKGYSKSLPRKAIRLVPSIRRDRFGHLKWKVVEELPCLVTKAERCGKVKRLENICYQQRIYEHIWRKLPECPKFRLQYTYSPRKEPRAEWGGSGCALFFHFPPIPRALAKELGRGTMIKNKRSY